MPSTNLARLHVWVAEQPRLRLSPKLLQRQIPKGLSRRLRQFCQCEKNGKGVVIYFLMVVLCHLVWADLLWHTIYIQKHTYSNIIIKMLFDVWPSNQKVAFAFSGASAMPQLAKNLACRMIRRGRAGRKRKMLDRIYQTRLQQPNNQNQPNNQCLYLYVHYELTGDI